MIHIAIMIGKIIGITIVCLLGLLLLLVILVLFVPIRYRVFASKEERFTAKANVNWLFHIVSVTLFYDKKVNVILKLLGIPLYNAERLVQKETRKIEKKDRKAEKTAHKNPLYPEPEPVQSEPPPQEQILLSEQPEEVNKEPKQTVLGKIKQFIHAFLEKCSNIKYTIRKICDRIKKVMADIEYYIAILQSEEWKAAYELCKEKLFQLWNHVKPGRYRIYLRIGTADPGTLGSIMAWHGMFYPLHKGNIVLQPDFEQVVLEGNAYMKGRITIFCLIRLAWVVYFNKNIRRVLALLKKEDS